MNCEALKPLLSGYVDSELTLEEATRVQNHLSHCSECRHELQELRDIEGVTAAMKHEPLPDVFWDRYWLSVYNRLERGLGWILLSAGAAILAGFGLWHFVTGFLLDASAPLAVRLGAGTAAFGLAILAVSAVRERIRTWRYDPYKEVRR